jgi:hypothetical protein
MQVFVRSANTSVKNNKKFWEELIRLLALHYLALV